MERSWPSFASGTPTKPPVQNKLPPAKQWIWSFLIENDGKSRRKRASHVDSDRRRGRFLLENLHVFACFAFKTCYFRFWIWLFAKIKPNPLFGGYAPGDLSASLSILQFFIRAKTRQFFTKNMPTARDRRRARDAIGFERMFAYPRRY